MQIPVAQQLILRTLQTAPRYVSTSTDASSMLLQEYLLHGSWNLRDAEYANALELRIKSHASSRRDSSAYAPAIVQSKRASKKNRKQQMKLPPPSQEFWNAQLTSVEEIDALATSSPCPEFFATYTSLTERVIRFIIPSAVGMTPNPNSGVTHLLRQVRFLGSVSQTFRKAVARQLCEGFPWLNEFQTDSILHSMLTPFSLIQGPPGTGKTVTAVALTYVLSWLEKLWQVPPSHNPHNSGNSSSSSRVEGLNEGGSVGGVGVPEEDVLLSKDFRRSGYTCSSAASTSSSSTLSEAAVIEEGTRAKVLYCGPSNRSVDNACEKVLTLKKRGWLPLDFNIVRVYAPSVERADIASCYPTLSGGSLKSTDRGPDDDEDSLEVGPTLHYVPPWIRGVALHHQISPQAVLSRNRSQLEREQTKILDTADVIFTTCACASDRRLTSYFIYQVVVDEATQSTEPETLIPLQRMLLTPSQASAIPSLKGHHRTWCRMVLVGDHRQLGPVVVSNAESLVTSFFERMALLKMTPSLLRVQYRMQPELRAFPSLYFYENLLVDAADGDSKVKVGSTPPHPPMRWVISSSSRLSYVQTSVQGTTVVATTTEYPHSPPRSSGGAVVTMAVFCHVLGVEQRSDLLEPCLADQGTYSIFNREEARKVVEVVKRFVDRYGIEPTDICVITPYIHQRECSA